MRFTILFNFKRILTLTIFLLLFPFIFIKTTFASHTCGYSAGDCGCELAYNQWSCVASTTRCFVDGGLVQPEYLCPTDISVHNRLKLTCELACQVECVSGCPGGDWQRTCAITSGSQHCYGGGNTCNADVRLTACESMLNTNTCTETVVTDTRECWVGGVNPNPTIVPGASPTPDPVPPPSGFPPSIKVIGVVFEDSDNDGKFDNNVEKILGPQGGVTNYQYQRYITSEV